MAENLFYALMPDAATALRIYRRILATKSKYGFGNSLISAEPLHVSLHELGFSEDEISAERILAARAIGSTVTFPSFTVTFDRALSFRAKGKYPYVLTGGNGLDTLRAFHQHLGEKLVGQAPVKISCSFTPHLTLLYDHQSVEKHEITPVCWRVSEFVLVRSFVGYSRYEIEGRWPLLAMNGQDDSERTIN